MINNIKPDKLGYQFIENLQQEFPDKVPKGVNRIGKYWEAYYKDLDDAYNKGAMIGKVSKNRLIDLLEKNISGLKAVHGPTHISLRHYGRHITWLTNISVVPKYSILCNNVRDNDINKILAHGWLAILDQLEKNLVYESKDSFETIKKEL